MTYEIQALIGRAGALARAQNYGLKIVVLDAGVEMVPLPKQARSRLGIQFCPLTDGGYETMPPELDDLCRSVSATSEVAYIEAEIFGGAGTQAFSFYRNGTLVSGPVVDTFAINEALNVLGVESAVPEHDEFDAVGLGKHRHTDEWC